MKKILAVISAILLIFGLAACGVAMDDIKQPTDVSTGDVVSKEPGTKDESTTQQVDPEDVSIEETVLVDESGVKITAKKLETDGFMGPQLKLLIENNSGKNLTVQARNESVNGYMITSLISADVADGKKANESMTFSGSELEMCGITTIADIEFSFHIFTTEDWETYLDTAPISIKTSAAATYEYKFDDSGEVAYEGKDVKVVVKGLSEDTLLGPSVVVYIENNSNKNVTVQTRDVSVNGFMVDAIFSSDVLQGKRTVDTITLMSSSLEENEITDITDIELSFHIFDTDSWDAIVDTDVVKITF